VPPRLTTFIADGVPKALHKIPAEAGVLTAIGEAPTETWRSFKQDINRKLFTLRYLGRGFYRRHCRSIRAALCCSYLRLFRLSPVLVLSRALDIRLESRLADAMTQARAMQRGGVGCYPHSGFIHIDTGPIRNWTLDERRLDDLLLLDGRQLRLDGTRKALPGGSSGSLTVTQRLKFQHQLARAEFLARTRGFRLNP